MSDRLDDDGPNDEDTRNDYGASDNGRRRVIGAIGVASAGVAIGGLGVGSSPIAADDGAASSSSADCVLTLMRNHRSIRRYVDEPLDEGDIRRAVEAAQMAATSSNVQAYALLHVTDSAKRRALVPLTGNQEKVAAAGAFFVVLGDARRHRLIAAQRGRPHEARLEGFLLAVVDASLFAQNLVLAFEAMGYGTCYIGGLRNSLPEVDRLLNLPEGVYPLYGLCVGRPAEDPGLKPRLPVEAVCFRDEYPDDDTMRARIAEYDESMRRYYRERTGSERDWSSAIAQLFATPARTPLAAYYATKGARLD